MIIKSFFLARQQSLVRGKKIRLCLYLGISRRSNDLFFFSWKIMLDFFLFFFLAVTPPTPSIFSPNVLFGQKSFLPSTVILKVNKIPCLPSARIEDFA